MKSIRQRLRIPHRDAQTRSNISGAPLLKARTSKWFMRGASNVRPACRLFCFPYSGGSASVYRGWQAALGPSVEVLALELPGHGARFLEAPVAYLDTLLKLMIDEVSAEMNIPSIFFGHSNGALIGYTLGVELMKRGCELPHRIVISGKEPPHLERQENLHLTPTPDLVKKLQSLNGTPPEILDDPTALDLFLPRLRADFSLSETYQHVPCDPLPCQLTLLGGYLDTEATASILGEWGRYFSTPPTLHMVDGGHFFIHSARAQVLQIMQTMVSDCITTTTAARATCSG